MASIGSTFSLLTLRQASAPLSRVYLTTEAWTQVEIGEVLSLGTAAAMLSQIPGGAVVDRLRDKRVAAGAAGFAVAVSAILFAAAPTKFGVMLAEVTHSFASCMLGPALAAISLTLVGRAGLGERLGRNACFASLGNGIAAAALGACGANRLQPRGVLAHSGIDAAGAACVARDPPGRDAAAACDGLHIGTRLTQPIPRCPRPAYQSAWYLPLLDVWHCSTLQRSLLPSVGSELTRAVSGMANLLIAACIVLPQAVVALISPWVGRAADRTGPRLVLRSASLPSRSAPCYWPRSPTIRYCLSRFKPWTD